MKSVLLSIMILFAVTVLYLAVIVGPVYGIYYATQFRPLNDPNSLFYIKKGFEKVFIYIVLMAAIVLTLIYSCVFTVNALLSVYFDSRSKDSFSVASAGDLYKLIRSACKSVPLPYYPKTIFCDCGVSIDFHFSGIRGLFNPPSLLLGLSGMNILTVEQFYNTLLFRLCRLTQINLCRILYLLQYAGKIVAYSSGTHNEWQTFKNSVPLLDEIGVIENMLFAPSIVLKLYYKALARLCRHGASLVEKELSVRVAPLHQSLSTQGAVELVLSDILHERIMAHLDAERTGVAVYVPKDMPDFIGFEYLIRMQNTKEFAKNQPTHSKADPQATALALTACRLIPFFPALCERTTARLYKTLFSHRLRYLRIIDTKLYIEKIYTDASEPG